MKPRVVWSRRAKLVAVSCALLAVALIIASIAVFVAPLGTPPGDRFAVSISVETEMKISLTYPLSVTVRDVLGNSTGTTFLSLNIAWSSLDIETPDTGDDPWGLPNVWNLTGLDLSGGRTYSLNVTPASPGDGYVTAQVWWPRGSLGAVQVSQRGNVVGDVWTRGSAEADVTIVSPFQLSVVSIPDLVVGRDANLTATVSGDYGVSAPPLAYVSVVGQPPRFRINTPDTGDDPWNLPNIWNVTGLDLSAGSHFILNVTAIAGGNFSVTVEVWSPKTDLGTVRVNESGVVENPESIFDWGSTSVSLSIRQGSPPSTRSGTAAKEARVDNGGVPRPFERGFRGTGPSGRSRRPQSSIIR